MQTAPLPDDSVRSQDSVAPRPDDLQLRAGVYSLLGALLHATPDRAMLDHLADFHRPESPGDDDVATALRLLGLAATGTRETAVEGEYHDLFIGLGRGELVPYGSWYLTGFLMEEPLSRLRTDLRRLGFTRNNDVNEPEDHIAALCEVMAMLISDGAAHEVQQDFFEAHLQAWAGRFFADLENADNACFYRSTARFGAAFFELENQYFAMQL